MTDDDVTPADPLAGLRALEALRDSAGEASPGGPAESSSATPPEPHVPPPRSP